MSLPRYPDYKHSGVDWLGEVPSHWKIERLKNVIDLRKMTVGDTKGDYTLLSLTLQGVIARDMVNPKGKFPAEFDTYQVVEKDDLVFCLFDVEETPRAVGISPSTGMITGAYTVGRAKVGTSAQYLYNFYLSRDQYKAFKMYYTGLRNVIRSETFNAIPCPVPPINEQIEISRFLEKETAKIDMLVTEQEKLIELLKEKRQSVISNAVTKGLYPLVKMSNSGVDWLGEIPEHWEITKIKYIATASNGLTYSPDDLADQEEGVLVLRSSNIQQGDISLEDNVYVKMAIPEKAVVRSGDILICSRNGSRDLIGKNALIPDSLDGVAYGAFMMLLRSDISKYIYWILNSYIFKFQSNLFLTSTINQLTVSDLYGFEVPIPPKSEQIEIIKYLQESTKQINSLIENAKKSLFLLQERRSALISAAVTGQIDVRNYQIKEAA